MKTNFNLLKFLEWHSWATIDQWNAPLCYSNNQESITQNQNNHTQCSLQYPENVHFMEDVMPLAFNKMLITLSRNWKGFQFLMLIKLQMELGLSRTYSGES